MRSTRNCSCPRRGAALAHDEALALYRQSVLTSLGDVENQKAAGGVLITLEKPSKQMRTEAADAGRFTSKLWHDKDYPRIQILTVEGLLNDTERVDAPPQLNPFAMAARESKREKQTEML